MCLLLILSLFLYNSEFQVKQDFFFFKSLGWTIKASDGKKQMKENRLEKKYCYKMRKKYFVFLSGLVVAKECLHIQEIFGKILRGEYCGL